MDLDRDQQRDVLHQAVERVLAHAEHVRDLLVAPSVDPVILRRRIDALDLEHGLEPAAVVTDVADLLEHHTVLTTHPRYFGLFNPAPLAAGIAADVLVAGYNPQLAVWEHAPAAVELEARLVREVAGWLGLPDSSGSFTTGGAEANATSVVLALEAAYPQVGRSGLRALPAQPVVYASAESHLAWLKIAQQCGLGRDAIRLVPVDAALRLDIAQLGTMLAADRAAGHAPLMIVATAGTTAAGTIDPLHDLADLADGEGLWLHIDAAWAGAAACSTRLRGHLAGIERGDSVTVDAHKWLSVPMGAGMVLTPHSQTLARAFAVRTGYMPAAVDGAAPDPYTTSMQWSRRAAGLKLLLALAVHGRTGYAAHLERDVALGEHLRTALADDGWRVVNDTPLPVVCVEEPTRALDASFHEAVAAAVVTSGEAWLSCVHLAGRPALRACVINHRTTEDDVRALVAALHHARARAI